MIYGVVLHGESDRYLCGVVFQMTGAQLFALFVGCSVAAWLVCWWVCVC